MHLFYFSVLAQRQVIVNNSPQPVPDHRNGLILAPQFELSQAFEFARNMAAQRMFEMYPQEEGYFGHSMYIDPVPFSMINELIKNMSRMN